MIEGQPSDPENDDEVGDEQDDGMLEQLGDPKKNPTPELKPEQKKAIAQELWEENNRQKIEDRKN